MSYFALHTKMYKTGKDRSPRVSTDALMNAGSPTGHFLFETCLCLAPWGFNNNPGQCPGVRLRVGEGLLASMENEKRDCERDRDEPCNALTTGEFRGSPSWREATNESEGARNVFSWNSVCQYVPWNPYASVQAADAEDSSGENQAKWKEGGANQIHRFRQEAEI